MKTMLRTNRARRLRPGALALALLYAFVLLGAAFAHHDLDCELKSRTHCTSCVFSQGSAGIAASVPVPFLPAPRAVPVTVEFQAQACSVSLFFGTDSSPPALSTL
jgi:hypothetical protein